MRLIDIIKKTHINEAQKVSELKRIIDEGSEDINQTDQYGWTPLHHAASGNCVEIINLLIDNGAAVNAADQDTFTPLHRAALHGCAEAAKILIEKGASVHQTTKGGYTPLHWAAQLSILSELNQIDRIDVAKANTVKVLVANGADVNRAVRPRGDYPLFLAVLHEYEEVVKALIMAGADMYQAYGTDENAFLCAKPELQAQMQGWFNDPAAVAKRAELKKNTPQPYWNLFVSFVAGVTVIYPAVKLSQYFWRLRHVSEKKPLEQNQTEVTANTENSQAEVGQNKALYFTYPSFSLFYEKGLEGEWGTRHTKEEVEAVPLTYRMALGL